MDLFPWLHTGSCHLKWKSCQNIARQEKKIWCTDVYYIISHKYCFVLSCLTNQRVRMTKCHHFNKLMKPMWSLRGAFLNCFAFTCVHFPSPAPFRSFFIVIFGLLCLCSCFAAASALFVFLWSHLLTSRTMQLIQYVSRHTFVYINCVKCPFGHTR